MEILYLLIPISVVLVFLIGIAFWWSLKHGQFDDLEGPGYRILMDDDRPAAADDDHLAPPASASVEQEQKTDKRM
jgi:cbb3-type cytochrome oxidase maturation protein